LSAGNTDLIGVLNPYPIEPRSNGKRQTSVLGLAGAFLCRGTMEGLFEFMFGASGRINQAKYRRSFLAYSVGGILIAFILSTAAGIAAPPFIVLLVIIFIPWLLWGVSISTERLHDRDKSAWWLAVFYGLPAVLGQIAKAAWFAGTAGTVPHYILPLAAFALTIWGFIEIGFLRGSAGSNRFGPDLLVRTKRNS
jgi:uncharacterized membrane protein YhaH (DUF805 family)